MHYFCPQNKRSMFLFKALCFILLTTSQFDNENDFRQLQQASLSRCSRTIEQKR